MGQCVHTCCGRKERWKGPGHFRIQESISWNEREIVDGIFMSGFFIYDYRSQCGFTSSSSCSGNGDEQRNLLSYFQTILISYLYHQYYAYET